MPNTFENYKNFVDSITSKQYFPEQVPLPVLHAALGVAGEAGEFCDAVKKTFAYGKELDYTNLDEECGDLLWYIQRYLLFRGLTLEDAINLNIKKLKVRYGENAVWSQERALNRDLQNERQVLEGKS